MQFLFRSIEKIHKVKGKNTRSELISGRHYLLPFSSLWYPVAFGRIAVIDHVSFSHLLNLTGVSKFTPHN